MSRSRERFLLKEEERRRTWGSVALAFAGVGSFVLAVAVGVWRLNDAGPPPPELLRPFATLAALLLLVLAAGLWPRLRPRHFVSIDVPAGTATFVRKGTVVREVPLAEVGPLRHSVEKRRVASGKTHRTATFHIARSSPFPELLLCESEDELATRKALESRAKAWQVPYVKPTGELRNAQELDVPVFQRMRSDEAATTPRLPQAGSKLAVTWKDGGYEVSTSYRPPVDRIRLLLLLLGLPALVVISLKGMLLDAFRGGTPTPLRLFAALCFAGSFVPGLVLATKTWLRARRPPVIRISAEGVRFRGRTLPLRSIEEVERVQGALARFVSDDRIVEIDADFCEPSERDWLHHELRRLVVEAGQRSPLT